VTISILDIVGRSAIALSAGVALVVATSIHMARPARSGSASLWVAVPLVAGNICLGAGSLGIGVAFGKLPTGLISSLIVLVAGIVGTWWATSIVVQIGQNLGYKSIGAHVQPIRWFNAPPKNARPRKNRRGVKQ